MENHKVPAGEYEEYHEKIGRWTLEEHKQFLHGIELHGKCWKKVASCVKTRSVVQIRTHAQKYFLKVQKSSGTSPLKLSEMNAPSPMIKKNVPITEPLPLLQSFNLLSKSNLSEKFLIPPGLSSVNEAPVAGGVARDGSLHTPVKQSIYQENDWFLNHFVETESPKVVTDGSDSGSDRKSSFDSTEDEEDDLHLEYYHAPPVWFLSDDSDHLCSPHLG
jgi:SHAQKYF class myb-like DNA-binding protein